MVNNDISLPDIPEIYKKAALEAEDISEAIIYALSTKPHVQVSWCIRILNTYIIDNIIDFLI